MITNWKQLIVDRYLKGTETNTTREGAEETGEEELPEPSTMRTNNNNAEMNNPYKKTTKQQDSNEKIKDSLPTIKPRQAERRTNKTKTKQKMRQTRIQQDKEMEENLPWGDPIGIKREGACRFHLQNINGISSQGNYSDAAEIGKETKLSNTDIRCLVETNIDWTHEDVRQHVSKPIRSCWSRAALITANNQHKKFETAYQPGGVGMIVSEEWSGRIEKKTVDERGLGRWATCTFRGKGGRKLTIITAYQVVKDSITKCGPKTTYMQQYSVLRNAGQSNPNPRKQFMTDLKE
jgi:hypothetical protein